MDTTQIQIERNKWVAEMPQLYRRVYRKAMGGRSLRAAVTAKCQDCSNWQRAEIRDCLVVTCSLWPYRPYRIRENRQKASPEAILENKSMGTASAMASAGNSSLTS